MLETATNQIIPNSPLGLGPPKRQMVLGVLGPSSFHCRCRMKNHAIKFFIYFQTDEYFD
jgi:hypothetical protein